jgi:hypothetical protein
MEDKTITDKQMDKALEALFALIEGGVIREEDD